MGGTTRLGGEIKLSEKLINLKTYEDANQLHDYYMLRLIEYTIEDSFHCDRYQYWQ